MSQLLFKFLSGAVAGEVLDLAASAKVVEHALPHATSEHVDRFVPTSAAGVYVPQQADLFLAETVLSEVAQVLASPNFVLRPHLTIGYDTVTIVDYYRSAVDYYREFGVDESQKELLLMMLDSEIHKQKGVANKEQRAALRSLKRDVEGLIIGRIKRDGRSHLSPAAIAAAHEITKIAESIGSELKQTGRDTLTTKRQSAYLRQLRAIEKKIKDAAVYSVVERIILQEHINWKILMARGIGVTAKINRGGGFSSGISEDELLG